METGWLPYLRWRDEFVKAINEVLYPLWWLDRQVSHGLALVLANDAAAVIYEYKQYPSGAWQVEGLVAAGDVEAITDVLIPAVEDEAQRNGVVAAQIESRKGWERVLRQRGYRLYQTTLRKRLV